MAVTSGHNDVGQLLVDHGAQVDCTDKNLRTALHRSVSCNPISLSILILLLLPSSVNYSNLCILISLPPSLPPSDPTLRDKHGCTPVHFAASCGHGNMLYTLLQYGGSPSTPDKHGYTPIHKASNNGHDKCLEILLDVSGEREEGVMWHILNYHSSLFLTIFLFPPPPPSPHLSVPPLLLLPPRPFTPLSSSPLLPFFSP